MIAGRRYDTFVLACGAITPVLQPPLPGCVPLQMVHTPGSWTMVPGCRGSCGLPPKLTGMDQWPFLRRSLASAALNALVVSPAPSGASKTVGADAAVRPLLFTPPRCGDPADAPADPARRAGDPGAPGAVRFMLADRRVDRRHAEAV